MKNKIQLYFHCKQCLEEKPKDQSPREYAQLEVGWTAEGIQIWCKRHDCNVAAFDFLGQKITYAANDEPEKTPHRKGVN